MVSPQGIQTEIEVLNEKIETFEQMLKETKAKKSDMASYLARKLAEYKTRLTKLTSDMTALYGDSDAA